MEPTTRGEMAFLVNLVGEQKGVCDPNKAVVAGQLGWMRKEACRAWYNPFASTLYVPGSTVFNTIVLEDGGVIHVWNYPSWEAGCDAYWATLNGSFQRDYARINAAYLSGCDNGGCACLLSTVPDIDTWGTGDFVQYIPTTSADYEAALLEPLR